MNLSLILIFVMILVVIPALVRRLFPKELQEAVCLKNNTQENLIENIVDNTRQTSISEIIIASSGLLALQSDAEEKQDVPKIIQKELVFEKMITIKAPTGQNFMGYALLQSLQNAGLKFSSQGFFYDEKLFELSPSIEPYRFNLAEIGAFSTPGLILKIIESADEARVQQIAEMLADELGGEVVC